MWQLRIGMVLLRGGEWLLQAPERLRCISISWLLGIGSKSFVDSAQTLIPASVGDFGGFSEASHQTFLLLK